MFIHFINDIKFVDYVVDQFELVDPQNHKYIYLLAESINQDYIKNKSSLEFIKYDSSEFEEIINSLNRYQAVFLHYLDLPKYQILSKANINVIFVWMIWGGDFYSQLSSKEFRLFDKKTLRLLYKVRSKNLVTYLLRLLGFNHIKHFFNPIIKPKVNSPLLKRINYYTTVLPNEQILVEKYLNINAKYLAFDYGSIESLFNFNQDEYFIRSNKILVGNSADPTNNQISIIDYLSTKRLIHREIIAPLNYGGNVIYIKHLLNYGFVKLGENFRPITNFLEKEKYLNILSDCSVVIMNHYRQQATHNILIVLWMGAKLFLSLKNPVFNFLNNMGVKVFSVEIDLYMDKIGLDGLSEKDTINNREILMKYYGQKQVLERTRNLLNTISINT